MTSARSGVAARLDFCGFCQPLEATCPTRRFCLIGSPAVEKRSAGVRLLVHQRRPRRRLGGGRRRI